MASRSRGHSRGQACLHGRRDARQDSRRRVARMHRAAGWHGWRCQSHPLARFHLRLDQEAIKAAKQWRFQPGTASASRAGRHQPSSSVLHFDSHAAMRSRATRDGDFATRSASDSRRAQTARHAARQRVTPDCTREDRWLVTAPAIRITARMRPALRMGEAARDTRHAKASRMPDHVHAPLHTMTRPARASKRSFVRDNCRNENAGGTFGRRRF